MKYFSKNPQKFLSKNQKFNFNNSLEITLGSKEIQSIV